MFSIGSADVSSDKEYYSTSLILTALSLPHFVLTPGRVDPPTLYKRVTEISCLTIEFATTRFYSYKTSTKLALDISFQPDSIEIYLHIELIVSSLSLLLLENDQNYKKNKNGDLNANRRPKDF